jgi:hypothetical protein
MHNNAYWARMPLQVRETLEMIATKMSRVVTGDPLYEDSWADIAGYAQIMVRDAEKLKPRGTNVQGE